MKELHLLLSLESTP